MIRLVALFAFAATAIAADPPVDRKSLKPGLVASFTEYPERPQTSTLHRLEPTVALLMKPGESMHPAQSSTSTAEWKGYIQIVTPGEYTFSAILQAGRADVSLLKDGKLLEVFQGESATNEPKQVVSPPVKLDAGFYKFRANFDYFRGAKVNVREMTRRFELQWQGPGFQREPIPYFFFGHLPSQRGTKFDGDFQRDHGRVLAKDLSCANCHHPEKTPAASLAKPAPDLSKIGSRTFPGWLDAWLADPAKLRPHTRMPGLFANDERGIAERYAVVQYLVSHGGALAQAKPPKFDNNYTKSLQNGQALFSTTGCAACHGKKLAGTMKRNDDDDEPPPFDPRDSISGFGGNPQSIYDLGGIGSKTTPDELAKFLKEPLKTNPHGKMPNMMLSNDEARDIARHLMRYTDESIANVNDVKPPAMTADALAGKVFADEGVQGFAKAKPAEQWRLLGQRLFVTKGCANCHTMEENGKPLAAREDFPTSETVTRSKRTGCADPESSPVKYKLSKDQQMALRSFPPIGVKETPAPGYQAREALKRFNCLNCHFKDGEGGLGNELADAMKKLESTANEDDVQPPRLTGIGHKATSNWLAGVMLKGERARPWMTLRMPQYGEGNVALMVDGLPACEGLPAEPTPAKPKLTAAMIDQGRKLVGKEGLGCAACHDISGYAGGGTRGPDLATIDRRVRRDWYDRWMHNPQRLTPGTKMPSNFTDGKSVSNLLNGDPEAQIAAMWNYLTLGPGLPLPIGLEPPAKGMPLIVKDRPEVLRTFIPDSGTKSIAVGFPKGEGSFVFDAHACRVAYAWEGNFLDVQPVWDARGGRMAKLLGPKFYVAPPGQPWAVTAGETPDFTKQAADYAYGAEVPFQKIYSGPMRVHFNGYALDDRGQPSFRYRVDDAEGQASVGVMETTTPLRAGIASGLRRQFLFNAPAGKETWFLLAAGAKPARTVRGMTVVSLPDDKALAFDFAASPDGMKVIEANGKTLLKLPAGEGQKLEFTVWVLPRDDDALVESLEKKGK